MRYLTEAQALRGAAWWANKRGLPYTVAKMVRGFSVQPLGRGGKTGVLLAIVKPPSGV
tara:strand:+ start:2526 stop:2699 length:174 start_codon:yes stop_codon:yes gene_type:complete